MIPSKAGNRPTRATLVLPSDGVYLTARQLAGRATTPTRSNVYDVVAH